jgi:hypothetical protein
MKPLPTTPKATAKSQPPRNAPTTPTTSRLRKNPTFDVRLA